MSDSGSDFGFDPHQWSGGFQHPSEGGRMHPEGAPGEADAFARRLLGDAKYEEVQHRQRRVDEATVEIVEARAQIAKMTSRILLPGSIVLGVLASARAAAWIKQAVAD